MAEYGSAPGAPRRPASNGGLRRQAHNNFHTVDPIEPDDDHLHTEACRLRCSLNPERIADCRCDDPEPGVDHRDEYFPEDNE